LPSASRHTSAEPPLTFSFSRFAAPFARSKLKLLAVSWPKRAVSVSSPMRRMPSSSIPSSRSVKVSCVPASPAAKRYWPSKPALPELTSNPTRSRAMFQWRARSTFANLNRPADASGARENVPPQSSVVPLPPRACRS
jgi:hypothetical protein